MSESDIHLKLDRILSGQQQIVAKIQEQDATIAVLAAQISIQRETIATFNEVINRLAEAISQEDNGSGVTDALTSIAVSLKQMKEDGARMVLLIGRLPDTVAQAAQDAVTMALGNGIDISAEGNKNGD